jgi:hypothetical protein
VIKDVGLRSSAAAVGASPCWICEKGRMDIELPDGSIFGFWDTTVEERADLESADVETAGADGEGSEEAFPAGRAVVNTVGSDVIWLDATGSAATGSAATELEIAELDVAASDVI